MDRRLHPASTRLWGQIEMLYRCHLLIPGENPPLIAGAVACARLENAPALIVGKQKYCSSRMGRHKKQFIFSLVKQRFQWIVMEANARLQRRQCDGGHFESLMNPSKF
jgi:hypothetical protein